jgi:hypothetical protein
MRSSLVGMAAAGAIALCACGGGGGDDGGSPGQPKEGDLLILMKYETGLSLFQPGTMVPALSGFEGNPPTCTLLSGALPAGVQMRGDCAIAGRPTAAGLFPFTVRVTVKDFEGAVDFADTVYVAAPAITYDGHVDRSQQLVLNAAVDDRPRLSGWTPLDGEPVNWTYALRDGQLPPGLTLDGSTGAVTGNVTAQGAFTAAIQARLVTPHGTYEPAPSRYSVNVDVPTFAFSNAGNASPAGDFRAYLGRPYHDAVPYPTESGTLGAFRLAAGASLPAGLALDPGTGVVSGTPTAVSPAQAIAIEATITVGGIANTSVAELRLEVVPPGTMDYGADLVAQVGAPLVQDATWMPDDAGHPVPIHSAATQRPGACTLPPGIGMHPLHGQMTGVPTAAGMYECMVDFVLTVDGVTWTVAAVSRILVE